MKQFLIALEQLINTLIPASGEGFGKADETISARAWRLRERSHWNVARIVIDSIFFDLKHCEKSYLSEVKRKQLPTEYVKFTCNLEPTKN